MIEKGIDEEVTGDLSRKTFSFVRNETGIWCGVVNAESKKGEGVLKVT